MTCRAEIVVDLDAIRANVAHLITTCGPVMAVVKADGYGHGMVPVARAARQAGASWLGTATLDEALTLREAGDEGPLLCWLAVPGEEYGRGIDAGIDLTAYTVAEVNEIAEHADPGRPARVQLKVDTGLSRGGATLADWPTVVRAAAQAQADGLAVITGVWSHFACADEPDHPANGAQEAAFGEALRVVADAGLTPEVRHLANSAGALLRPSARFDLVRCGIASYGLSPAPTVGGPAHFGLTPAMSARATVAAVKSIPAGAGVSYGHHYVATQDTTVAVVPVGYGDGIPVHASGRGPVLAAGARRTVIGRVCMDQFVIDLGEDSARPGDDAVLFGPGLHGEPTVQDWAEAAGTINYEIVTRIGGRFERRYEGER